MENLCDNLQKRFISKIINQKKLIVLYNVKYLYEKIIGKTSLHRYKSNNERKNDKRQEKNREN